MLEYERCVINPNNFHYFRISIENLVSQFKYNKIKEDFRLKFKEDKKYFPHFRGLSIYVSSYMM